MLGMLLNSVDGRFRGIPPTGVYTQPVYTPNLPDTIDTFFSKKVLGVEQCWACCSIAIYTGWVYTPVPVYTPKGVYPEPAVHAIEQHAQHCSTPKTFLEKNVSIVSGRLGVYTGSGVYTQGGIP